MLKYFRLSLVSIMVLLVVYVIVFCSFDSSQASVIDPSEYEEYINSIVTNDDYNDIISNIIKESFPEFNMDSSEFNNRVVEKSSYKILEIIPITFSDEDNKYSKINDNLDKIKQIYYDNILRNNLTSPGFITNMPNFELETMTMKQFVADRSELSGKYDAIIFAPGNYHTQETSCYYNYLELYHSILYKDGILRYYGTTLNKTNELDEAIFHGYGLSFYDNGDLEYIGNWYEGKRNCFGISYDKNYIIRYMGQWQNDLYNGFGISFNEYGFFEYIGYFYNGEPTYGNGDIPEDFLNDITNLKAQQIIIEYIEKGLPVFISNDSLNDSTSTIYEAFNQLLDYDNVFLLKTETLNTNNFYTTLSIMKLTELYSVKPNITFTKKPVDYYDNPNYSYYANDLINFEFSLTNMDEANLKFYLDVNQNEIYEEYELLFNFNIYNGRNEFSFHLPELYSKIIKYKIIVEKNELSSLYEGYLNVKSNKKEIKVLNVTNNYYYDYLTEKNYYRLFDYDLYKLYFEKNHDYNITVDICPINEFKKNNSKWDCSHTIVMDNYDVILLSSDIYNYSLNTNAYKSIKSQIDNGKPIIFTSSITRGHHKWLDYFGEYIGFSDKPNDIYKLNNTNDKLEIINQSSFVLYPYDMNKENVQTAVGLNYTINEGYQMDLEIPTLIPLMNMYNTNNTMYDLYDSYNNFYYTKNNNIVYLNIGYNPYYIFKDTEHKLLVNAIANLYVEDKAKEQKVTDLFYIQANNEFADSLVDINENISFTFKVNSIRNEDYNYILYINDNVVVNSSIESNKNIDVNIDISDYVDLVDNNVEELKVKIRIEKNGAIQEYKFLIYVTDFDIYKIVEPNFTEYIFIPYGETVDIRDYFNYNSEFISELEFYLLGSLFEIDGYNIKANNIGEQFIEVVAYDKFGNTTNLIYNILSYEPIENLNIGNISITQNQEYVIDLEVNSNNIKYELISGYNNIVNISREDNGFIITGINIGEAQYRFYGYDNNGNIIEEFVTFTVLDASDILFKKSEISIFIFNQFSFEDLKDLIIINNPEYSIEDVKFTSLNEEIINIDNTNEEVIINNYGEVIIEATLPNGEYASLKINVFDKIQEGGFKAGLEIIKIYVGVEQYLDNYIYTYPENIPLDSLVVAFEIVEDKDSIIIDFNTETNTFNTNKAGYITLKVIITQVNYKGEEVLDEPLEDVITLRIYEEPNSDDEDVS